MIIDLYTETLPAVIEADVCIIGAGAAGIALARDLATRNVDVVLLESGGRDHEPEVQALNTVTCVGLRHSGAHDGRFRALGGSTTKWLGQMLPLWPLDLERRPWVAWSGWPLQYDDLVPYYRRTIECVGLGAGLADREVWRGSRVEPPEWGDELEAYFSRWCPQPDFARLFGAEIERSNRLRCILHATAVHFAAAGGLVTGVTARSLRGHAVEIRARNFVVCVGGIETPRLLLQPLAGGGPAAWADMPALGGFFQDHLFATIGDVIPRRRRDLHQRFDNIHLAGIKYRPYFALSAQTQRRSHLLAAGGTVVFQTARTEQLDRLRQACREVWHGRFNATALSELAVGAVREGPSLAGLIWRSGIERRGYSPDDLGARLAIQLEQAPRPDSRITLGEEVDALGMRRAKLDWRVGQLEIETTAAFAECAKRAIERTGLARVDIDADVAARSPELVTRLEDFFHHMGTARMAESRDNGVVDTNLKVFGSENLYVCGSAVYPASGISNPTQTIIALALRLADHLRAGMS